MDNLTEENAVLSQTNPIPVVPQQQPEIKPKSNFLTIFLSILLLISVVIAGFFAYQTQNLVKELNELKTKYIYSPTQLDESEVDPTADWKTYLSDKYSLSFKYPNNIVVEEEWVGIGDNSKAIYQIKLGQIMNLEIRNLVQRRGGNYKEILLDSGVILYEDLDSSEKYVFFDKDNLSYDVMLLSAALEKEFDQILSTFKFTKNPDIPNKISIIFEQVNSRLNINKAIIEKDKFYDPVNGEIDQISWSLELGDSIKDKIQINIIEDILLTNGLTANANMSAGGSEGMVDAFDSKDTLCYLIIETIDKKLNCSSR